MESARVFLFLFVLYSDWAGHALEALLAIPHDHKPQMVFFSFPHYFSGPFEGHFHADSSKIPKTAYFVKKRMPNRAKK